MRRRNDPITAFRFALELGFLEVAGFQECVGLKLETKLFEYPEGGRNGSPLKFPERGSVGNVTLKRGIAGGPSAEALFQWQRDVMTGSFSPDDNPNIRPTDPDEDIDKQVAIVLKDEAGNEIRRWRLVRAIPVRWEGPECKAASSEVAVETLELACEGMESA